LISFSGGNGGFTRYSSFYLCGDESRKAVSQLLGSYCHHTGKGLLVLSEIGGEAVWMLLQKLVAEAPYLIHTRSLLKQLFSL
jgi:hypothetical protein